MEHSGHNERIDHRNFADQGKDEQPTIHEGVAARIVEKKGGISERCEINRQIREDNRLLRELKALVSRLTEAAKDAITTLARKLETIRANMIGSFYALRHNSQRRSEAQEYLEWALPLYSRYTEIHAEIKDKFTSLRRIQREKDALPVVSILKHRELSSKIEALEAEISKLRKKEKLIMQKCDKTDHAGMEELQKQINERRATIQHVDGRKPVIRENIHKGMHLYVNLINEFDDYDPHMLMQDRLKIRPDAEAQIRTEIAKKTDLPIQEIAFAESTSEAEQTLNEQKNVEQKNRNEQEKRQIRKKHRQNIR